MSTFYMYPEPIPTETVQLVVSRAEVAERLAEHLAETLPTEPPGRAQRPALDWCPDALDTVTFLCFL